MTQILIYTTDSNLSDETLVALKEASIIPVCVADLSRVKLIEPIPVGVIGVLTRLALKAVVKSDAISREFGKAVAEAFAKDTPPASQS